MLPAKSRALYKETPGSHPEPSPSVQVEAGWGSVEVSQIMGRQLPTSHSNPRMQWL